jgi:hypothetical protein
LIAGSGGAIASRMSADQIFGFGNQLALAGWAILILLPRRWRIVWIPRYVIPAILSFGYAPLVLANFFTAEGGFSSIAHVRALFENDLMLTAGWLHYLAFDLFVGSWIAVECDRLGAPRTVQAALLIATFMFGPVGFLLFVLMRTFMAGMLARGAGEPR